VADAANREKTLRAALDASVHDSLKFATGILASLLGAFVFFDLLTTIPASFAVQVALVDLVCAAIILFVHFQFRRNRIPVERAQPIGAGIAILVGLGTLHDAYVLRDPSQITYLMLVAVATGSLLLDSRWVYAVGAVAVVGFAIVASAVGAPDNGLDWTTFGLALFAACVLSVLIHIVRYRTLERFETLRLQETGRKEQLQIRESALEAAVVALQESEERYRRLVEGAPDAFIVHTRGQIVYANTAAVRLFGATAPQELQGRDLFTFFHPDDRDAARRRHAVVELGSRATEPAEMRCIRLDGTSIEVETLGQPITYFGRPADQTVIRDITDRKRADAERQVASQRLAEISRLKEMDRVKTQFVNTISHELRTPLTPIKVQLHILKNAKDPEGARKSTDVIERNVQRLSSLVDELLEVARIQAGTLKLAMTYVDVSAVVSHALDSFVDVARQNGIELASKLEPEVNVLGDARRLQQVMYNLMGNAFKFTQKGGSILVEVHRDGPNAVVSVRDSGAGLQASDVARLFEPFSQVHDTMEQTNAGTGLGLYICRGIVEGHGGRIHVESEGKGHGSRFVFTIPLSNER